jgi:hypothetical protein
VIKLQLPEELGKGPGWKVEEPRSRKYSSRKKRVQTAKKGSKNFKNKRRKPRGKSTK